MTEKSYYRWALALPLLVHGIVALVPGPFQGIGAASVYFGGIPYLVWAGIMAWATGGMDLPRLRRAVLLAPLGFLLIFGIFYYLALLPMLLPDSGQEHAESLGSRLVSATREGLGVFSIYILVIGYVWVLLIRLGWRVWALVRRTSAHPER